MHFTVVHPTRLLTGHLRILITVVRPWPCLIRKMILKSSLIDLMPRVDPSAAGPRHQTGPGDGPREAGNLRGGDNAQETGA